MKNKNIRQMTIIAMFIAIMAVMTFVPQVGFISITPVIAFTLLHIPVLVGAYLYGWKYGTILGLAFGLLSFFRALVWPVGVLDPFFVNPLISVLPRLIFGLLAGLSFDLIKKLGKKPLRGVFLAISCFILTLLHSVMVLTMLGVFNGSEISALNAGTSYWILMGTTVLTNGLSEAVVAALIVPTLVFALKKAVPNLNTEKLS